MTKAAAKTKTSVKKLGEYFRAVGRRKEATAIARIFKTRGSVSVNGRALADYFPVLELQKIVEYPLHLINQIGQLTVVITAKGGGLRGQAEAARLAISRALVKMDKQYKSLLRGEGLLSRDAREKERKKPGLKKARRASQWRKR